MTESILSWNVTNWITVVIMAAGGFFLASLAIKAFKSAAGSGISQ